MDPNACIRDLMFAITQNDREACHEALDNLHDWLRRGGFAPRFDASIAGRNQWGKVRESLPFHGTPYAIMTVEPGNPAAGYALMVYGAKGNEKARYPLATAA